MDVEVLFSAVRRAVTRKEILAQQVELRRHGKILRAAILKYVADCMKGIDTLNIPKPRREKTYYQLLLRRPKLYLWRCAKCQKNGCSVNVEGCIRRHRLRSKGCRTRNLTVRKQPKPLPD